MYIGVDGGGTKTAFILIDETGQIRASHTEKTSSYLTIGIDKTRSILKKGIAALLSKSNVPLSDVKFTFFGLPAYGEDQDMTAILDTLPASFMTQGRYRCDNDTVCGWAGSLACADGINIVAGTGSISYGENKGKSARVGGWGELFGDEGSAYWIACEGLNIFTKMSDGRLPQRPLYEIIKAHFSLEIDLDLPGIILDKWHGDRSKIAALSTIVYEAAIARDEYAIGIFSRAGQELAVIVDATRKKLGYHDSETVKLSYSGGVFKAEPLILSPLKDALKRNYIVTKPRFSPVIGAALYAAKQDGLVFDEKYLVNIANF
ncbi:MAG: N-acetylglucosamine kinase [Proteobacteria bacterium]|jgi:N-acetylglucosamine kinase-like BadF-type ATPase|nr:N-acetylglucosamine kinase [Pseudomonadota bacterium]